MPKPRYIPPPPKQPDNPWEVLVLSFLFAAIGFALLFARQTELVPWAASKGGATRVALLTPGYLHFYGWAGIGIGLWITDLYLRARRELRQ